MTKRRYVPRKKLGNKRIDLPLTKKKEYLRRIITLKQPYSEVKKINMKEFGKDLPQNTFRHQRLEEEEKQFLAAEQDEVQEVPVSKKKPQEEEKKKIQRQITSFFLKKE